MVRHKGTSLAFSILHLLIGDPRGLTTFSAHTHSAESRTRPFCTRNAVDAGAGRQVISLRLSTRVHCPTGTLHECSRKMLAPTLGLNFYLTFAGLFRAAVIDCAPRYYTRRLHAAIAESSICHLFYTRSSRKSSGRESRHLGLFTSSWGTADAAEATAACVNGTPAVRVTPSQGQRVGSGRRTMGAWDHRCACRQLSNFDSVAANLLCIVFIFRPSIE